MERQYKAFISYRHLPLDKETAIQVHRAIEHFVIPQVPAERRTAEAGLCVPG